MTPPSSADPRLGLRSSSTSRSSTTANVVVRRWGTSPRRNTNSQKPLNRAPTFRGELHTNTPIRNDTTRRRGPVGLHVYPLVAFTLLRPTAAVKKKPPDGKEIVPLTGKDVALSQKSSR